MAVCTSKAVCENIFYKNSLFCSKFVALEKGALATIFVYFLFTLWNDTSMHSMYACRYIVLPTYVCSTYITTSCTLVHICTYMLYIYKITYTYVYVCMYVCMYLSVLCALYALPMHVCVEFVLIKLLCMYACVHTYMY